MSPHFASDPPPKQWGMFHQLAFRSSTFTPFLLLTLSEGPCAGLRHHAMSRRPIPTLKTEHHTLLAVADGI